MSQLLSRSTRHLKGDLFGGITAAIVALPLALAFGVASGAGAVAGLYGAISVGFLAALFGGTPSQISGPTGPMSVIMGTVFAALMLQHPDNGIALAFTVVMFSGVFQILFGVFKLGRYITLMPYTVISGFMSGIGFIILIIQIAPLVGHPIGPNVLTSLREIPAALAQPNWAATSIGILTLLIVFGSPPRLNRIIPSPLLALVICTVVSMVAFSRGAMPRIDDIPPSLPHIQLPAFTLDQLPLMIGYGLMLAALGSIDSILTSLVADNLTQTEHNSDQELIGQGLGNLVSGLFGGLPGAGATMRTVINIKAGGRTPLSGMIHAVVLLGIVLGAGPLTAKIPHTVLAGILIKVAVDIIDWSFLRRAHRISRKTTGIMYLVLFLTVFVDLVTAVAVGVFIANVLTLERLSKIQQQEVQLITTAAEGFHLSPEEQTLLAQAQNRILLFQLGGAMSFGAARSIAQRMGMIERYDVLILDFSPVLFLGVTASLAVETMVKAAVAKGRAVFLVGAKGEVSDRLHRLEIFQHLPLDQRVSDRLEALQQAVDSIQPDPFCTLDSRQR